MIQMHTREIPKETWKSFLESFSLQHELWRVSLDMVDQEQEAHAEIRELPLIAIGMSGDDFLITLRNYDGTAMTHVVRVPEHLWLEETEEGAHKSLQIQSCHGIRTIISFRSAVLPESMNGILNGQAEHRKNR